MPEYTGWPGGENTTMSYRWPSEPFLFSKGHYPYHFTATGLLLP